ncbi:uncharacterized protein TNCV_4012621 [Trichonephila clavipes]|nr:uncharacterized protein TNCV_4012621 [Trichonephila clavipes]
MGTIAQRMSEDLLFPVGYNSTSDIQGPNPLRAHPCYSLLTLKRMIARFEKTGHLGVHPGRGRKSTRSDVVEDVATAIVDQSMDNVIGCSSARAVSRYLGVPYSTV